MPRHFLFVWTVGRKRGPGYKILGSLCAILMSWKWFVRVTGLRNPPAPLLMLQSAVPTQQDAIKIERGLPRPLPHTHPPPTQRVQFTVKNMTISTLTLEIMLSSSLCISCNEWLLNPYMHWEKILILVWKFVLNFHFNSSVTKHMFSKLLKKFLKKICFQKYWRYL